jgi:hypothetical protein
MAIRAMRFSVLLKRLMSDKEVVLEAVKQAGDALQHTSEELKGDKEVGLEAVKLFNWLLQSCRATRRSCSRL